MERQRRMASPEHEVLPISPFSPRLQGRAFPPITELVPHRPPMLLLDRVVSWDHGRVVCGVVLRHDSPFVVSGRVSSTVAIEYMAQCIAVYAGLGGHARSEPVRIGYLLGSREVIFEVEDFRVGDELRVEASHLWGDDALGSFACAVHRRGRVAARGTLNVFRGDLQQIDRT